MKSKKQKRAWREVLIMTSDPKWDENPANVKRHRELMAILNMPLVDRERKNKGVTSDIQKYLDKRPGMEEDILAMIKRGMTVKEMQEVYQVSKIAFTFIRKKYGYSRVKLEVPPKDVLSEIFFESGTKGIAEKWGVSKSTVYCWLDECEIDRPRGYNFSKKRKG